MSRFPADHAGLEILPYDECLRLLGTVPVGRVSFLADGEIVVLPVTHVMDGQAPVFRTARGSKLSAAEGQEVVAFEADAYDAIAGRVLAASVTEPVRLLRAFSRQFAPAA